MHINSNLTAIITNNVLLRNESAFSLSTGKLSSGYKINTAGDDPTGYAISGRMRQQLAALERADVNATTGKSVLETADGALNEVTDMLQRLNELSIKASNGTMSASDRADIQQEVKQLTNEIQRISEQIELNGQKLLDGHLENHGYCDDNKLVQIEEYNDKMNAGKYKVTLTETFDPGSHSLTINATIETTDGKPVIKADLKEMSYPKYLDPELMYQDDPTGVKNYNGTWVTEGAYGREGEDAKQDGYVKICEDGTQYLTLRGNNGEEINLRLDKRLTQQLDGDGKQITTKDTEGNKVNDYKNISGLVFNITLTGQGAMDLHIGANEEEVVECSLPKISLERLDIDNLNMTTKTSAQQSIDRVTYALKYVSSARAQIGAYTNRVEHSISYIAASNENLSASMSRIQDTDMAQEMTNYASQQILVQAATSMLAQANQAPQQALQLIQ
ncbi:MAG: hypothetical protein K5668_07840 [Lachnospiraceae bacterium]|nr:hypothetical protein [Lachnospiraceae bacterium]